MADMSTNWYTLRRRSPTSAAAHAAAAGKPSSTTAELWIYGDIGESWYGETVEAKSLVKELAEIDASEILVRINSYGGSVSDGIAIHAALKRHPARIIVSIDGIAASIASFIAMAGDEIEISEAAQIMVHAPWAVVAGNAAQLREFADRLDMWAHSLATGYAAKTGRPMDELLALLADGKDHTYTAEQALADKLVDRVVSAIPVAASASRHAWARQAAPATSPTSAGPVSASTPAASPAQATPQPLETQAMTTPTTDTQAAIQAAAQAAARAEHQRQADIRAHFAKHITIDGMAAVQAACIDDLQCTPDQAGLKVLAKLGECVTPMAGARVVTLEDETDKRKQAMASALDIRAGLAKNDAANPYRGHTMVEMARLSLAHAGVRTDGLDKMGLIAVAFTHSTSDFPQLLANVAQKAMMKGYEEAGETFGAWTSKGTLPDFKPMKNVDIGSFPALRTVPEGGEYKYITVGERGETRVLATFGERFSITRQSIINDDLQAFSRIPKKLGRAAVRTVGNLAYGVLTANANMADGVALFHASHGNLQGAGAISTATVDAMRVAMAVQKAQGQTSGSLGIRLAKLIVPVALEGLANVVRNSEYEVSGSKNLTVPNSVKGGFEVISDPRLDDASATVWYGAADAGMHDVVTIDYLDGNEAPTLEQQAGWGIDGVEFKVRIDAAAKALDYRTLARNG
jgi:ATP-dependent protease ClpP protease subunit